MSTTSGIAPAASPPLGREVLRGSFWMMVQTGATRGLSLVAQVLLAWFLSDHDFGLYAIALSLSTFTSVLRDGGVRTLLIQRPAEYERLIGPVFWMATTFNFITGLAILALAPLAAHIYEERLLLPMLAIIAVSVPLGTPGAVLGARLAIDLRFRGVAGVSAVSALVRFGGSVLLAWWGMGPLSFVLPLPFMALVEWAMSLRYVSERLWSRPAAPRLWRGMLSETKWIILGSFAVSALNMGNYFLVALLVPDAVVGVYFFAYQFVLQIGVLVSANLNQVLFPALARLSKEPERQHAAVRRCLRQIMLVGVPLGMGLVPTFAHLEAMIWAGKWERAALPVQLIALFYPPTVVQAVGYAALQAWGEFRRWAVLLSLQAVGMLAVGMVSAAVWGDAVRISLATSLYMMLAAMAFTRMSLRSAGVSWGELLAGVGPTWIVGLASVGGAVLLDRACAGMVQTAGLGPRLAGGVRAVIAGSAFLFLFAVLARIVLGEHLSEAVQVVPRRFRPALMRLLYLHESPG